MNNRKYREKIEEILAPTEIKINGNQPWDPQVYNNNFYPRVLAKGSMALGETYMDGWWDAGQLDEFFHRILRANIEKSFRSFSEIFNCLLAKFYNFQKISRAYQIGEHHYNISNELYKRMLDKRMTYSCGYWKNAENLDDAQKAKLDLICRKLKIGPEMKILDIGCGWGGAARFIARRYKAEVVGVTISKEQAELARERCKGLPVTIQLQDYRELEGKFNRIFSIGMFEHVGYKNYKTYMKTVRNLLKEDGIFLLHTIGGNHSNVKIDPWINKYIFPNSMLPSAKQISEAIEGRFVIEDWQNFGADYDTTLMTWYQNFENNWDKLKQGYSKRFYRMWKYYLLCCAGSFRARKNQLWQIVLSPKGIAGGYQAPR
ncbi:MAG: cyclopropane fatty acyl phospholipid synthase [Thermodesulfobacteriota bacterium]